MKKKLCVVAMMAVLMLWGCTPDEKKGEAPGPKTKPTAVQVKDKAVEVAKAAEEKLKEATKEVVEATKAVEEKVEQKKEQKAVVAVQEEKVEEATKAVDEAVEKKAEQEAAVAVQEKKVEEATKAVDEAVEKKVEQEAAVAVQEEKVESAVKAQKEAASVVEKSGQAAADKITTTVESVVLDNDNGKVVLSHKKHADAYGCAACHGDKKPGPFEMDKESAHALCQGCHKEKKAGPTTNCTQCHQKKDKKSVEGC